jgi:tRNA-2-methylthio-N6-dimethylallyladenosine synthase
MTNIEIRRLDLDNNKKVFIQTFGCQMNKLDSELITGALLQAGYQIAESESEANIILVNTCSVREHAEERVYSRVANLKPLKAKKPGLVIGIIGCMAQKDKEQIFKRLPHVSLVCGPHRYKSIVNQIDKLLNKNAVRVVCSDEAGLIKSEEYEHSSFIADKNHAYVQVMRGCDNFCSYCIVPYVRGKEISRTPEEIIKEVSSLLDKGVREITLLGQNVTSYRSGKTTLASLLKELVKVIRNSHSTLHTPHSALSFITSHPRDITDELLETMVKLPEVKREIHMPAQSGSDRILKMMNRGYTRKEYLAIVRKAKTLMPDIKIVSDFIVGFPTETDEDFQDTVSLVKEAGFSKIYVFKYSPRSGTKASKLPDDVLIETKKYRNNYLLDEFKRGR